MVKFRMYKMDSCTFTSFSTFGFRRNDKYGCLIGCEILRLPQADSGHDKIYPAISESCSRIPVGTSLLQKFRNILDSLGGGNKGSE